MAKTQTKTGGFARVFQGWNTSDRKQQEDSELLKNSQQLEVGQLDGAELIDASFFASTSTAIDQSIKNQAALINEYRTMSHFPEVDWAIDDIINAVVSCDTDDDPISISLENVELGDPIKVKIADEFKAIVNMMEFSANAYELLRQWYVDGRLIYQVIVDDSKKSEGIQKLIPLDPRAIKKVAEYKRTPDENRIETITSLVKYYVYDQAYAFDNQGEVKKRSTMQSMVRRNQKIQINLDAVAMVHSGLVSTDQNLVLSYLEKAKKAMNNLRIMEDAMVIYRITRAPERRAFYVDVGSLPKKTAEEYLTGIMNRFKSKISYDSASGTVNTNATQMSMTDDFWLPRREGGTGTSVETLPGGQNLSEIDDVRYFLNKLYKSLNVPTSRLEQDNSILIGGRGAEISRDEWKFSKFVERLRRRFANIFTDLLGKQLVLKNICTQEDWESDIRPNLKYIYASDGYMKEQQELDTFASRINILTQADSFVGKYFSKESVERQVLRRSDEQIKDERTKIMDEIKQKLIKDPMADDEEDGPP